MHPIVAERQVELAELCRRFYVTRLEVFGSAVREDFDPIRSDVDLLVEFAANAPIQGFAQYFGFKEAAEALLGRPVDLVEASAIRNPYFAESVNETRVTVYAAPGSAHRPMFKSGRQPDRRGVKALTPSRESRKYLWDALRRVDGVMRMTASRTFDDYLSNEMLRLAVERQLEVTGEALNQLSQRDPATAEQIPELRQIVAFRNILAHGYEGLDDDKVWSVVQNDLPALRRALARLLEEE